MSPARYPVSDHEYVQRVRRHPPSSLLPLIAATSGNLPTPREMRGHPRASLYGPWALADVAWVSLTRGNEHRGTPATDTDLREILEYHFALDEPLRHQPPGKRLEGFLLRLSGQQLSWQEPEFSELTRTLALLEHTTPTRPLKTILPGWDRRLFGCSLTDYVGTAQLLWAAATRMNGRLDPNWLAGGLNDFEDLTTPEALTAVIDANFATTTKQLRDQSAAAAAKDKVDGKPPLDPNLRRFSYNPLRGRPALADYGPGYLVPVPSAVIGKASPYGIYFSGVDAYGSDFANDLGELFEQYVGRQLNLLPDATVHPEVVYTENKSPARSVDWFVVFDSLVLLVEVKSTRPTAPLRLGPTDFAVELDNKLGKAMKQIQRSADRITAHHPDFAHIPTNRPLLGMAVTMEPYHFINAPEFRTVLPPTMIPVTITAATELEDAVALRDASLQDLLLTGSRTAPAGWSVRQSLQGHELEENPILASAWESFPFSRPKTSSVGG